MFKVFREITICNANSVQELETVLHSMKKKLMAVSKGHISKWVSPAFIVWVFHLLKTGLSMGDYELEACLGSSFSYTISFLKVLRAM